MAVEGEEGDIDLLNDETFGDGAVEYDWEASHFSQVAAKESHDQPLPSDRQEQHDQLLPKLNELKIKELWPSSPQQEVSAPLDSIWSTPELPVQPKKQALQARGSPSIPPGSKAVTLEELEREFLTPSPSTNSASQSTNHTPPLGVVPPPGLSAGPTPATGPSHPMLPFPPPMGQRPPMGIPRPHPMMGGWMMPPHGRYPLPHGFPHPRAPPPNVPIRPHRGQLHHHYPPHGPPPPQHSHRPSPHPHHSQFPPSQHRPSPHHHRPHQQWSRDAPEAPRKSRRSEYLNEMKADGSGFMTQKEKEWVIRIQLLQLQSPDPSNDDYYYQNFIKRKLFLKEEKQSHPLKSHDHSSPLSPDANENSSSQPQILTLPQIERKERNYRPIEFQGTLGKVAPSSISAPRKTIDIPLSGGSGGGVEGVKDTYAKKKQTLAVIEKLYLLALNLEGMEQTVLSLPDEERVELLTKRDEICRDMFSLLKLKTLDKPWTKNDDITFQLMMGYRKGKRVMKRVLPMLSDEHAHIVLLALIRNLPTILKKDSADQVMPELTQCVLAVIADMDLPLVNFCLSLLLTSASTSSGGLSAIVRVVQGGFGASLVLGLVRRGRKLAQSSQDPPNRVCEEWVVLTTDLSVELHPHHSLFSQPSSKTASDLLATLADLPHLQQQ